MGEGASKNCEPTVARVAAAIGVGVLSKPVHELSPFTRAVADETASGWSEGPDHQPGSRRVAEQ